MKKKKSEYVEDVKILYTTKKLSENIIKIDVRSHDFLGKEKFLVDAVYIFCCFLANFPFFSTKFD